MTAAPFDAKLWITDRALRGAIAAALALPYRRRVPAAGWAFANLLAPLAGYRTRIRDNLALVRPDLGPAEVDRLCREVPDNVGRAVIEIYSGADFMAEAARSPLVGPGVATLEAAARARRPAVLVSGHFGNYDAPRAALISRGMPVGALYRPMTNPYFNTHYVAAMSRHAADPDTPIFERGRRGMAEMVRHLKRGGMLGILMDQRMVQGARLTFFGQPAMTALSAAEMALKYDTLLMPVYGIRRPDGIGFDIHCGDEVRPSTPAAMQQALNDSLEAMVRAHMGQWLWVHRRWRP